MKKIFAVLDSKDVYGKELSNIEVCKTLEEHGYDITILYNKDASERLKQEINKFRCIPIFFPRNIYGTWRGIKYVIAVIYSNLRISMLLAAQKPDVLLIPTEMVFIKNFEYYLGWEMLQLAIVRKIKVLLLEFIHGYGEKLWYKKYLLSFLFLIL